MDVICHIVTYRLSPFITFLAFKSGLATSNHIGLLIVPLIVNIFLFSFQTKFFMHFMPWIDITIVEIQKAN